ncbi:hypothetical protein DPH57_17645 [Massilia sp. YMA4]|nr:hypothetical protein DPH57_17645 [Massilia sp. YMA4]
MVSSCWDDAVRKANGRARALPAWWAGAVVLRLRVTGAYSARGRHMHCAMHDMYRVWRSAMWVGCGMVGMDRVKRMFTLYR